MKATFHTFPIECHRANTFVCIRADKGTIPSDLPVEARRAALRYLYGSPDASPFSSPVRVKGEAKTSKSVPTGATSVMDMDWAWMIFR